MPLRRVVVIVLTLAVLATPLLAPLDRVAGCGSPLDFFTRTLVLLQTPYGKTPTPPTDPTCRELGPFGMVSARRGNGGALTVRHLNPGAPSFANPVLRFISITRHTFFREKNAAEPPLLHS